MSGLLSSTIFQLFSVSMGIQWLGFLIAFTLKTELFYDLTGSLTFILLSCLSYDWSNTQSQRQFIQKHMIMLWAARLGLFLFIRIMKAGHDRRFNEIKASAVRFFVAWNLQGIWVFMTLLPTLMMNNNTRNPSIGYRDYCGWLLWAFGISFEIIADFQKSTFKMNIDNKDKFISSGLWSFSRHPNYFGEILLWIGLYISASSTFKGMQFIIAIMSPVFIYLLITQLSGIPILEKSALKRWGHLKEYQNYVKITPVLIPKFF